MKWSLEEENILKENYKIKNKSELLDLFPNRTWKAIKNKANSMNIKSKNDYEKIPEDELYKIIDNIVYKKCKKCGQYYPLTKKYFPQDKACKDGHRNICKKCKGENFEVSTNIQWTNEEVELLKINYPIYTNKELIDKFFPNRNEKSLRDKASSLNIYKEDEILLKTRQDRFTEEVRNRISQARIEEKAFVGEKNPMYNSNRWGELNPNWQGGITPIKKQIMNSEEYKIWRLKVFERDNYTCQCCGRKTHKNEAHHLDNFAEFIEKRFDVDNGITLCEDCHNPNKKGSFHNVYGTLHNTKEQFEEYLSNKKREK